MNRPICAICGGSESLDSWVMDYVIPDGWSLPARNTIRCCKRCGFIWYDNDATPEDYAEYYKSKAGFGLDNDDTRKRLDSTAAVVQGISVNGFGSISKEAVIADFGGGGGYLVNKLKSLGYNSASVWDIGDVDPEPETVDLITAVHVLEHVIDIDQTMLRLRRALKKDGLILVETPDAEMICRQDTPQLLDFHVEHVNHFKGEHVDKLMERFGLYRAFERRYFYAPLNAVCYQAIYSTSDKVKFSSYYTAQRTISGNINKKIGKLVGTDGPVIIWGCGTTVWHVLACLPELLDHIAYFVDVNDNAYPEGSTIKGIPVKHAVDSDHPIVVMAQGQRQAILDNIRALGLTNEVIEV